MKLHEILTVPSSLYLSVTFHHYKAACTAGYQSSPFVAEDIILPSLILSINEDLWPVKASYRAGNNGQYSFDQGITPGYLKAELWSVPCSLVKLVTFTHKTKECYKIPQISYILALGLKKKNRKSEGWLCNMITVLLGFI